MEATVLTKVVLPIALAIIMLGMGLSLVPEDFKRVLKAPKAFLVGLLCQMVVLPAIGFAIAFGFGLPPLLAVGLVILALCPGGTTSNMFTYLAKGDVALSISLTAIVSLLTPFTIPLIAGAAMSGLLGEAQAFQLPLVKTIATLLVITVVPVGIGMLVRRKWAAIALRAEGTVKVLSIVFLFAIIAGIAKQNWAQLPGFFAQVGWAALALNIASMAVGFGIAGLFRLRGPEVRTISIEVGIQNGTTALFVTSTILANPTMSIAPAVYSLIMFITGFALAFMVNGAIPAHARRRARRAAAAA